MNAHSHRHAGRFTILLFAIAFTSELAQADEIQVCFNPPVPESCDATKAVVQALASAREQVLVQAWGLISAPIAQALVEAERRVLDVRVILDRRAARRGYPDLERAGVLVLIDSEHAVAHSSVMIIDRHTVITGSFNFTRAAQERNAEDLVVIRSPEIAAQYVQNWNNHAGHSQPLRTEAKRSPHHQVAPGDAESEDQRDQAVQLTAKDQGLLSYSGTVRKSLVRGSPTFASTPTRESVDGTSGPLSRTR
jgi:phosphatidylserine/phosphatidylglycerophosphate/cardiolipin synthase-like enzyme